MNAQTLKENHKKLAQIKALADIRYSALDQSILDQEQGIEIDESIESQLTDAEERLERIGDIVK